MLDDLSKKGIAYCCECAPGLADAPTEKFEVGNISIVNKRLKDD